MKVIERLKESDKTSKKDSEMAIGSLQQKLCAVCHLSTQHSPPIALYRPSPAECVTSVGCLVCVYVYVVLCLMLLGVGEISVFVCIHD